MSIQKYKIFLKVVELGSFTRVAESMNYTQSGISRIIQDLEEEWQLTLMERSKSGIELTSDGMKLVPILKTICQQQDLLMSKIDELHNLDSGLIRIGTFSSVATHWLPPMIKRFRDEYPKIEFELLLGDYQEIEEWINDGRVDFGFLRFPINKNFEHQLIEEDRLLAVLPKGHPLTDKECISIHDMTIYPFMLLEKGTNRDIVELFKKYQLTPQVFFTTWDDFSIMSMVENELGISILPELILKRSPYKLELRELDPPEFRRIGLAMRSRKSLSLAAGRFLEYLNFRHKTE